MIRLSQALSKVIKDQYGSQEFLRRLSDPLWFQAFGCVLGFDWHSSGVTTVVTWLLKQSLAPDVHGISITGGKGAKATSAMHDIPKLAENFGLSDAKIHALEHVAELIHGTRASWNDPVKYGFAYGGKDGVPTPVAKKVYDQSISYLQGAIEGAEIDREARNEALKKLALFSEGMFAC